VSQCKNKIIIKTNLTVTFYRSH